LSLRALAGGIVVICACALITRLLPHVWPTAASQFGDRLGFPVGYDNALGLLAALGAVLCLHFASDSHERGLMRVVAAAAIPVQACTLYFTFSRGGILATLVGVLCYAALGRPRALLSAAVAAVPTTIVAVLVAYHANVLANGNLTSAQAVIQGHHVTIVVAACVMGAALVRGLLLRLDRRLERFTLSDTARRRSARIAWASAAVGIALVAIVLHGTIARQYHQFSGSIDVGGADPRSRLTSVSSGIRVPLWRVAWHGFESAPLIGHGAGTFAYTWAQHKPYPDNVVDAHSLYFEVLDELGVVGLILVLTAIVTVLACAARRIRGPTRPLYAAVFAVLLMWAIHAGLDWDWELPVLTIIFFALGGMVLARPARADPTGAQTSAWLHPQRRVVLALGCLLLGVAPVYVWLSQRKVDQALAAFANNDCRAATGEATSSLSIVGANAEPYDILAYCDAKRGMPQLAVAAINKAVSLDPHDPNYVLDLAVIRAAVGLDPMKAARQALALEPLDPDAQDVWQAFKGDNRTQWQADGQGFLNQFVSIGDA
jgi:hypothetical protein